MDLKTYDIILADPPFNYTNGYKYENNRKQNNPMSPPYPVMDYCELAGLPICKIAKKNSAIFMWCSDSQIFRAAKLMEAWGFNYKVIAFVWEKYTALTGKLIKIPGSWTTKSYEYVLLGIRGTMKSNLIKRNVSQKIADSRREDRHSSKPIEIYDKIESMFGKLSRIELFARHKVEGWDIWGNEVESNINLKDYI